MGAKIKVALEGDGLDPEARLAHARDQRARRADPDDFVAGRALRAHQRQQEMVEREIHRAELADLHARSVRPWLAGPGATPPKAARAALATIHSAPIHQACHTP